MATSTNSSLRGIVPAAESASSSNKHPDAAEGHRFAAPSAATAKNTPQPQIVTREDREGVSHCPAGCPAAKAAKAAGCSTGAAEGVVRAFGSSAAAMVSVSALATGVLNTAALWFTLHLDDAVSISSGPHLGAEEGEPQAASEEGESQAAAEEGEPHAAAEEGEPQAAAEEGEPQAAAEEGKPQAAAEEGEPQAAAEEGEPQAVAEEGEPQAAAAEGEPQVKDKACTANQAAGACGEVQQQAHRPELQETASPTYWGQALLYLDSVMPVQPGQVGERYTALRQRLPPPRYVFKTVST